MDVPQGHATCWKKSPGCKWTSLKGTPQLPSPTFWSDKHIAKEGDFCRATLHINYWWVIVRCLVLFYWPFQNINVLFCECLSRDNFLLNLSVNVLIEDFQGLHEIKCFLLEHIKLLCLTIIKIILDLFTEHLFCGQLKQENH